MKTHLQQGKSLNEVITAAKTGLTAKPNIKLEYLDLVNPVTLKPACNEDPAIQACIAAWVDGVRLIDNMRVK